MRIIRSFLVTILVLSLIVGCGSIPTKKTVSAASASFIIHIYPDFTLKLPRSWDGNYIEKFSKGKKPGSYVTFYSKKCYKQKKEGWLFTIMRYKDNSYKDVAAYELIGEWKGIKYVALYPTDVQTEGVTKAARKQYQKLAKTIEKVVKSIQPR